MTDETSRNGYTCPYCGIFVTDSGHTCQINWMYTFDTVEVQLLRQILAELQIIERKLEEKL